MAFRFAPVYTLFTTITLTRRPDRGDQRTLTAALAEVEKCYPFAPGGVFTFVGYGISYFRRYPVAAADRVPRLLGDRRRFAFEEAVPSPTDVSPTNPTITKETFNVPVRIEANDMLIMVRSDSTANLHDVLAYLTGTGVTLNGNHVGHSGLRDLLHVTSSRLMFTQIGLPRHLADGAGLPYASEINPQSPMWMGFADQQVSGAGPAAITTFAGNQSARLTTARAGDYFDNGSVVHLSHVIEDLAQFYRSTGDDPEVFTERCQYMFRSDPIPSPGNADQFTDGGGPAYLENLFQGAGDALANANPANTFTRQPRSGHLANLQQSSRPRMAPPCISVLTAPGLTRWTCREGRRSRSCSSACSSRPPSSSG